MAKISGSEKNNKLIEQVKKAIETIITTSKTLDNTDDENLVVSIDGKKILVDEEDHYKKLVQVKKILDFSEKPESELFAFEEVYVEKSKQETLFELANDDDLGIEFPSAFGQYGEIPGTDGLTCPRPKSMLETFEGYEAYLKQYYKEADIDPTFNEDGVRLPYPHEKYIWVKGQAQASKEKDYVSSYYKAYKDWKENGIEDEAEKGNSGVAGDPAGDEEKGNETGSKKNKPKVTQPTDDDTAELSDEERSARAKERTEKRKGLNRRKYAKDKKTLGDYLKAPFRKLDEADKTLSNGKNWPKIKRVLVGAAVAVGAVALLQTAGLPLLSVIWTGLTEWPAMLISAITGVATQGGTTVALTAIDRLVMGIIGVAVPVGAFGIVKGLADKWKKTKKEAEEKWEREHGNDDDEIDDTDDKTKGKGDDDLTKGKGKGTDTGKKTKPTVTIPEGSLNDKITFIKNALTGINEELDIAVEEQRAIDASVDSPELKKERLEKLSENIKKLKTKRDAYMEELAKLVTDMEIEAATKEQPAAIHTSGGMNK